MLLYPKHPTHDEKEGRKTAQSSDRGPADLSDVPVIVDLSALSLPSGVCPRIFFAFVCVCSR